jgi:hypothetical protein
MSGRSATSYFTTNAAAGIRDTRGFESGRFTPETRALCKDFCESDIGEHTRSQARLNESRVWTIQPKSWLVLGCYRTLSNRTLQVHPTRASARVAVEWLVSVH